MTDDGTCEVDLKQLNLPFNRTTNQFCKKCGGELVLVMKTRKLHQTIINHDPLGCCKCEVLVLSDELLNLYVRFEISPFA